MKKIDTTKPVVDATDSGINVRFLHKIKNSKIKHGYVWIFTDVDGSETLETTDENGVSCALQVVKNVPETITFWVPVWRFQGGIVYIGRPKETQDKPTLFCDRDDLIKWAGPFTTTID